MVAVHSAIEGHRGLKTQYAAFPISTLVLQCTLAEFIGVGHDSTYDYVQLCRADFPDRAVLVGFNRTTLPMTPRERSGVVQAIIDGWKALFSLDLVCCGDHEGPRGLPFEVWEMIQSVHFLYEDPRLMGDEQDYQLFKIVYPKTVIEDKLELMR